MPPPVGDSESWPTPDTATSEERRKSATFEKADKLDNKPNGSKSHTKQWTHVPYVPSVVFETQLPPAAARRGGRPGNRGRDGTGRGGLNANNSANTEKSDAINTMPPPLPRQHHEQERGRRTDSSRGGRAASVPTQGNRNTSVTGMASDGHKASETLGRDRGGFLQTKPAVGEHVMPNTSTGDSTIPSAQDTGSVSRPATNAAPVASSSGTASGRVGETAIDTHTHPTPGNDSRPPPADWHKSASFHGHRNTTDFNRDGPFSKIRQHQGDKSDASRAKVESWRDRETQADQNGRREPRPERGRGSYRSRGTHSAYGAQTPVNQSFTAPLPQQPFPGAKPSSFHDGRHRQSSQSYAGAQSNRNNPRNLSIPTNNMYQPFPNGMIGMNQPLSPIQTDMQIYGYPQMHPGVMSAMPYSSPLESYALMSMVTVQV